MNETRRDILKWIQRLKSSVAPMLDGKVDKGDLLELNRQMRRLRRWVRQELQEAIDDPQKMDVIYMIYAVLAAAESAILLSSRR